MTREELAASIAKGFRGIVEKLEQIDRRLVQFGNGVVIYQKDVEERLDQVNARVRNVRDDVSQLKRTLGQ